MKQRRKKRVLKLETKVEIAIPGTPKRKLKDKKIVIGRWKMVETKADHIKGQVVPLLRKKIRRG